MFKERGLARMRFIPAHAGNMNARPTLSTEKAVHPRTRGEHENERHHNVAILGSSPHTRGTSVDRNVPTGGWRFIPAHAGNIGMKRCG